jgi:hypothetical protein
VLAAILTAVPLAGVVCDLSCDNHPLRDRASQASRSPGGDTAIRHAATEPSGAPAPCHSTAPAKPELPQAPACSHTHGASDAWLRAAPRLSCNDASATLDVSGTANFFDVISPWSAPAVSPPTLLAVRTTIVLRV